METVKFNLKDIESIAWLVDTCKKYPGLEIDVVYGSYTVDGRSFLGVSSLVGKEVTVNVVMGRKETTKDFYKEIKTYGN